MAQLFVVNTLGGFLSAKNLSKKLRVALQPLERFRQFCDVKDAAGKNKGQTFTWDVVSDVGTQGGTIAETNTMPETQFTIGQATLTITEYGNSVPYSGKLEALSELPVRKPIMQALRNDAKKVFDKAAYAQFYNTKLRAVSGASGAITLTTDGTATQTSSLAITTAHIKTVSDTMKERNIAPWINDDYMGIAWPTTWRTFKNDLEAIRIYTEKGINQIYNGEIGRYESMRFTEQTNVDKGITATGSSGVAWDVAAANSWAFFFGEDTVAEGIAIAEEIRAKIPTDYGRSKGVAWYYLGGFGIVHTTALESRIVMWDTAS